MYVIKRASHDGTTRKELVSFDKVLRRINLISSDLNNVEPFKVAQYVISNIIDGITTSELDEFTANYC